MIIETALFVGCDARCRLYSGWDCLRGFDGTFEVAISRGVINTKGGESVKSTVWWRAATSVYTIVHLIR